MLFLLRKIRRKLMQKNKVTTYLLYAIGEIILVVIGILIAVSINNRNEEIKSRNKLKETITALRSDLIQDTFLIQDRLPEVKRQYLLNESLRGRVAKPSATIDTLLKIVRTEFNPNWTEPLRYNTNSYNSLVNSDLIEILPDSIRSQIKNFYNQKFSKINLVERITNDYRGKLATYVNTYTFGSTSLHDQGPLIDSLVWSNVDHGHLAASFQGLSNFKRILFDLTNDEMEFSHKSSKALILHLDQYLSK
ncbi:hypothetical protein SAMN05421640_0453 [Ekhidna lutea]|uniref:Uncharacterized protein n=2 Tax=Ekhidna lutea TaxID=447679 RepID=A0A239F3B9_EKHLU|nr:hypothetical protein SAMN05421640_0453 [Ekhidna lutea]